MERIEAKEIEEKMKGKFLNLEEAAKVASGFGVAKTDFGMAVTFYLVPPEDEERMIILSRVFLCFELAKSLIESLQDCFKEPTKPKEQPTEKET